MGLYPSSGDLTSFKDEDLGLLNLPPLVTAHYLNWVSKLVITRILDSVSEVLE